MQDDIEELTLSLVINIHLNVIKWTAFL